MWTVCCEAWLQGCQGSELVPGPAAVTQLNIQHTREEACLTYCLVAVPMTARTSASMLRSAVGKAHPEVVVGADDVIPQGVFLGALGALALIPPLIAARLVKHASALARSQPAQPAPGLHGGKGVAVPSSGGAEALRAEQTGTGQAAGGRGTHNVPEGSAGPELGGRLHQAGAGAQEAQTWPEGAGSAHPGSLDKHSSNGPPDRQSPVGHAQDPQGKGLPLAGVLQKPLWAAGLAHLACALRLGSRGSASLHGHAPSPASSAGLHSQSRPALSGAQMLGTGMQAACWLSLGCLAFRSWWAVRGRRDPEECTSGMSALIGAGIRIKAKVPPAGSRRERRIGACARVAVTLALLTLHCAWLSVANWALAFLLLWLACPAMLGVMQLLLLLRPRASTSGSRVVAGVDEGSNGESELPGGLSFSGLFGLVAAVAALGGLWLWGGSGGGWLGSGSSAADPTLSRVGPWLLASCVPLVV